MEAATVDQVGRLGELLTEANKLKRVDVVAALQEEFPDFEIEDSDNVGNLRAALATLRLRRENDPAPDAEPTEEPEAEVEGEVVDETEAAAVADEVGKALALREATPHPQSALPTPAEFNASLAIAERIANSSLAMAHRGKPDDVLGAILFGREIGLGPMQSLRDVYMVDGRPALAAHLQLALLRRGGVTILESETTAERAYIRAQRKDTGETMAVEWTYEEASKIVSRGKSLVSKDNWQNYPADMLFARCVGRLTRRLGSDLIGGLPAYVAEEVADFDGWGVEYGEGGQVSLSAPRAQQAVRQEAAKVETPKSWAEIAAWAEPYGPEIGWGEWVRDAADRLYNERDLQALPAESKRLLSIKAAGAIVKLRDTVEADRFPPPNREEIQRAWASVLDGEILPGPQWRLDPKEADLGAVSYYEFHGLPEPGQPTSDSSTTDEGAKEEEAEDAVWSDGSAEDGADGFTDPDDLPFGDGPGGYEG